MDDEKIDPMLGMTVSELRSTLWRGLLKQKEKRAFQNEIAAKIEELGLGDIDVRARLIRTLQSGMDEDQQYARGVSTMVDLLPRAINRNLGVDGFVLLSVSSNYRQVSDILMAAIRSLLSSRLSPAVVVRASDEGLR